MDALKGLTTSKSVCLSLNCCAVVVMIWLSSWRVSDVDEPTFNIRI